MKDSIVRDKSYAFALSIVKTSKEKTGKNEKK